MNSAYISQDLFLFGARGLKCSIELKMSSKYYKIIRYMLIFFRWDFVRVIEPHEMTFPRGWISQQDNLLTFLQKGVAAACVAAPPCKLPEWMYDIQLSLLRSNERLNYATSIPGGVRNLLRSQKSTRYYAQSLAKWLFFVKLRKQI